MLLSDFLPAPRYGALIKMAGTMLAHAALHDQSFPSVERSWIKMMTGLLHSQVPHNMVTTRTELSREQHRANTPWAAENRAQVDGWAGN